ncbi:MAG TPA: amidase family protein, partial [Candidatus Saccharimonadales bacterium]|nr:amidase family protein [Candidatus Saccharimonadales bacterium]
YMDDNVEEKVRTNIREAAGKLKAAGATVGEVSIPSMPLSLAVYYILCPAEVSSNLSRYDGQRYPYSYKDAKTLDESYTQSRSRGFGAEAKRRIMIGTHVLSSGYYEAYYMKAQTVRTKLIDEFEKAFKEYDFLMGPVSPTLPFKIGEKTADPLQMYLADLLMTGSNLAGICSISVPSGRVDGLPVGLQIMAPQRADRALLELARQAEEVLA